mmetsp:Transcript_21384/g.42461  ORF Transcript_21384/g.42461 Transcript_21384/m.42461 type:complete len:437 (+) Transcript_21384:182-1492(+)
MVQLSPVLFCVIYTLLAPSLVWSFTLNTPISTGNLQRPRRSEDVRRRPSRLCMAETGMETGRDSETEEQRLALDQKARDAMAEHMTRLLEADSAAASSSTGPASKVWKWRLRKRIWDYMEDNDIADFPRPVHNRIPNFKLARDASDQLANLPEFQSAKCVKVNPDTPQKQVRYRCLAAGKLLLVPQPRLRTGFFSVLDPAKIPKKEWGRACTSEGVKKWGVPLSIEDEIPKVDLIVVGSVAVSPEGGRIGKGEGFAELEYGILKMLGTISDDTPVVTATDDCQTVDPSELPPTGEDRKRVEFFKHDVPVDIICTPTRTVRTETKTPKPEGIYWDLLSPQKLSQIRVLQQMKAKIEKETGETLPSGPDEILPPIAKRGNRQQGDRGKRGGGGRGRGNKGRGPSSQQSLQRDGKGSPKQSLKASSLSPPPSEGGGLSE